MMDQRISISTVRRSCADVVLNPIINSFATDVNIRAPRYYDAQFGLLYKPSDAETFDIAFLLSDDQLRFLGDDGKAIRRRSPPKVFFKSFGFAGLMSWTMDGEEDKLDCGARFR